MRVHLLAPGQTKRDPGGARWYQGSRAFPESRLGSQECCRGVHGEGVTLQVLSLSRPFRHVVSGHVALCRAVARHSVDDNRACEVVPYCVHSMNDGHGLFGRFQLLMA